MKTGIKTIVANIEHVTASTINSNSLTLAYSQARWYKLNIYANTWWEINKIKEVKIKILCEYPQNKVVKWYNR